jgi:hypothetical protein
MQSQEGVMALQLAKTRAEEMNERKAAEAKQRKTK